MLMIRTNPPIASLILSGDYSATMMIDPWKEQKSSATDADAEMRMAFKACKIDPSKSMTPEGQAKLTKHLEEVNLRKFNAICININGLYEAGLKLQIEAFVGRVRKDPDADLTSFLKGTTLGGKTKNMASVIANMLKTNLPPGVTVKSGVKSKWELADLVRYACEIRDALERSGVAQPRSGYAGLKTGMIKGFGIYPVAG